MLVFIDESGDSGMKGKTGSSELFVMAAVIFEDHEEAERCDQRIGSLRRGLSKSGRKEYKFNTCNGPERIAFFQAIAGFDFFYMAFVLNKRELYSLGFQFKSPFYKYTASLLFQNAKPYLKNATVVVDRSGDREFRQQLSVYLKRKVNVPGEIPSVGKFKMEASHSNHLLQMADMIVGAVARSFRRDKQDADSYRKLIYHRELALQLWPKGKK